MPLEKPKSREHAIASSLILFFIGMIGCCFKFIFNAFLARHLSAELYGDFAVALKIFSIASGYMLLGTATSSKRFFSSYLKKKQHDIAAKYLSWNLRIVLFSAFLFLLLLTVFSVIIIVLHFFHIRDIRKYHLLVYFLWLSPLGALSLLFASYLMCNRNMYLSSFFDYAGFYFFGFVLLISMIFLFNVHLASESLWILVFCIYLIMVPFELITLMMLMRHLFAQAIVNILTQIRSDQQVEHDWWRVSSRLIVNQFAYSIVNALDILLLELIDSNEKVVGYYAAALVISKIIWVARKSLIRFVSPVISTLLDEQDGKQKLQTIINKLVLTNLTVSSALITLIVIFSNPILQVFGPHFIVAKIPLWILLGTAFIAVIGAPAPKLLAYSGHEKYLMYISIIEMIVIILSGVVLIFAFGIIGAALAVFIATLLRTIIMIYFVRTKLEIKVAILF